MTTLEIVDIDHGGKKALRNLANLKDIHGYAGIFEEAGTYPTKGNPPIAMVAFWNQFGTRNSDGTERIPERPFMSTAFDEIRRDLEKELEWALEDIIDGKATPYKAIDRAGKYLAKNIKKKIVEWKIPRNADSTIAKKGFDDPLIETRRMLNSVKFKKFKKPKVRD